MSSVADSVSAPNSALITSGPNDGLRILTEQDEENIIEVKGNKEVGITGGSLKDEITTGAGDAIIFAGGGDDMVTAGNGNDIVRGGDGDDMLSGRLGADVLMGGEGNDILRGGMAAMDEDGNSMAILNAKGEIVEDSSEPTYGDILHGGSGDDIFQFSAAEFEDGVVDKIVDFKDDGFADTIKIFGVGAEGDVSYDDQTGIVSVNGNEAIDIGAGKDVDFESNEDNDTWSLF